MELSQKKWKSFKISEIFRIESCKCGNASLLEDGDDLFYRGAKKNDNGVIRRVKRIDSLVSKGNCIMFICDGDGSCGYTNYISDDFIGSTTTSVGYNENLNVYIGTFITTILDMHKYKYSHSRKYRNSLLNEILILPINNDGIPDWKWIEEYMKSLSGSINTQIYDIIDTADGDRNIVKFFINKIEASDFKLWLQDNANMDVNNQMSLKDVKWKGFKLSELFNIERGCRLKKSNRITGNTLLITAEKENHGIAMYVEPPMNSEGNLINKIYKDRLTIDMFCNSFYQSENFICDDNILVLIEKQKMTKNIKHFIATILSMDIYKFSFTRQYRQKDFNKHIIMLPINDKGNLDWEWIEEYMKSLPYSDKETRLFVNTI